VTLFKYSLISRRGSVTLPVILRFILSTLRT
jgi:hypothetical protein